MGLAESFNRAFRWVFPTFNDKKLKELAPLVSRINDLEPTFKKLDNHSLKGKTAEFKSRLAKGETLDQILPEAFATVRESASRVLGQRHYDCQLIGGIALHQGIIIEMKTGEGKTLVSTLPAYLNALSGKGVHIVTVNEYLASRDAEWMGQVHRFLNLTVGMNLHGLNPTEKRAAYYSDITYSTNNELGFDYLRDNMCHRPEDMAQREPNFCVIDEVDSVLIDEARTPLIISGPAQKATKLYSRFAQIVKNLKNDLDFNLEEKTHGVSMTETGITKVEGLVGIDNLYDPKNMELVHQLHNALKAKHFYKIDKDYVVKEGLVIIVDEFTGRLMHGRRYSDGLHQAIEAKENVKVEEETITLASITFQNYFRLYNRLSGMTGTAQTEAKEFGEIYKVPVLVIPTNVPIQRKDQDDLIYRTTEEKYEALIEAIYQGKAKGQPILVGTRSIEISELIANKIRQKIPGVKVLNAKHHEKEAEIVAQAGRFDSVTIATNMAGRGTDIVLGGNFEFLTRQEIDFDEKDLEYFREYLKKGHEGTSNPTFNESLALEVLGDLKEKCPILSLLTKNYFTCREERGKVIEAGGLLIIGTERHDSRRIDNQLRGRAGRQGDPGESQFYLSLEDQLFRLFGGDKLTWAMEKFGDWPRGEAIQFGLISMQIEGAQKNVENYHFDIRKNVLKFDDVMNEQRERIYKQRKEFLFKEDISSDVYGMIHDLINEFVGIHFNEEIDPKEWDGAALAHSLHLIFPPLLDVERDIENKSVEQIIEVTFERAKKMYQEREKLISPEMMRLIEKMILLQVVDQKWKDHLQDMETLQEGIHLRAWGQRDPVIEFKMEALDAWNQMIGSVREDVISFLFKFEIGNQSAPVIENPKEQELIYRHGDDGEGQTAPSQPVVVKKVGRNDPCHCNSGKKFKHCHGV